MLTLVSDAGGVPTMGKDRDSMGGRPIRPLTPRQEDIARLIGEGLTARAIARELGISFHTVRAHIGAISRLFPDDACGPYRRIQIWAFYAYPRRVQEISHD